MMSVSYRDVDRRSTPIKESAASRGYRDPSLMIGLLIVALAGSVLLLSWLNVLSDGNVIAGGSSLGETALAVGLLVATIAASRYSILGRNQMRLLMSGVPLYLLAVLLPPALAATTAALAVLTSEMTGRMERHLLLRDVGTATARYTLVTWLCAEVAQQPVDGSLHPLVLIGAALIAWAVDLLTAPLLLSPIVRDRPWTTMRSVARETYLGEGVQYVLGLLGALATTQQLGSLVLLPLPVLLVYHALKSVQEIQDGTRLLLESMADTVDLRDPYTGGHSRRVTEYTMAILQQLQIGGPEASLIISAARVHDIGKIGIPDAVLNKPGPLTEEERGVMQTHAERGAAVLERYPMFDRGIAIVRHHHESWDGTGYPQRVAGEGIPFGARVIAVADSYDAMTSDRPYRKGMPIAKAAGILCEGRGTQWDAHIVDALLATLADRLDTAPPPVLRLVPHPSVDDQAHQTEQAVS